MDAVAVILCAGKGTRMNDDTKNKVCFDCAGVPVIKRIIQNMRRGGVTHFVIVVGHQASSVMDCLDGEDGVLYAYQKEQKGTGHAAMCGFKVLENIGYSGPVIVSMGDKIIAPHVVSDLLERERCAKAVLGVQPVSYNKSGGRVVTRDGKPCGIVEFADAAMMALADVPRGQYVQTLTNIGVSPKKIEKICAKAETTKPAGTKVICGHEFRADEILNSKYANAALYCFDLHEVINALGTISSDNAQGELYLTDTIEYFAKNGDAVLYEVQSKEDMLTYSTKPELRLMSRHFLRTVSEYKADILSGAFDSMFRELYRDECEIQKKRYLRLVERFAEVFGDRRVIITRSPGRVNLMGRHIEHRGGSINVMATDKDTVFIASPREDDIVHAMNLNDAYPERSFSIGQTLGIADHSTWLGYLEDEKVVKALNDSKGDWSNYIKSAVLRAQLENEMPLCGMDMIADGTIPVAAGLSSSSSIVVATMEAVVALNCLNISDSEFINICGEGEWFVGSRGGAGDHAAMKCGKRDTIVHLGFKPFEVGESMSISDKYAVIVANSMQKAKKSEGSKDKFNAKVASYEFALMLLKRNYPMHDFKVFRDVAKVRPYSEIYKMLKSVPETMTRGGIKAILPEYEDEIKRIFANHADPIVYNLRGVALYGISECVRSEKCLEALSNGDYKLLGELMKISHNGDRIKNTKYTDELLDKLAEQNADIALQCGSYDCSTEQIDYLCDVLNETDGVLGSELVGAGLGGCVIALVEKEKAESIISVINEKFYDKYGYEHSAQVYMASCGSSVVY